MKTCTNCIRYPLLCLLTVSCALAVVVLGLDLDLLINGPNYLSKVFTNLLNRYFYVFTVLLAALI